MPNFSQSEIIAETVAKRWAEGNQGAEERDRIAALYLTCAALHKLDCIDLQMTEMTKQEMKTAAAIKNGLNGKEHGPVSRNIDALSRAVNQNWRIILGVAAIAAGGSALARIEDIIRLVGG